MKPTNTQTRTGQTGIATIAAQILRPIEQKEAKKAATKYKPTHARFKLKIYYLDGGAKSFFSYDMFHKYTNGIQTKVTDEETGYTKLFAYLAKISTNIQTAILYCTDEKEKGTDAARYNFEIYKCVHRGAGVEVIKNQRVYFANGYCQTKILQLQEMEAAQ